MPSKTWTKEDCIAALKQCAESLGESPSALEYKQWRSMTDSDVPSAKTLSDRFGSWNAAKRAAELETYQNQKEAKARKFGIVYDTDGYQKIRVRTGDETHLINHHRLIATCMVGSLGELGGKQIHHKNGHESCNFRSNLEVVSPEAHVQIHTAESERQEGNDEPNSAPLPDQQNTTNKARAD